MLIQELERLCSATDSAHLLQSASLIAALNYLDQNAAALSTLKGKAEPKNAFAKWGTKLAELERKSQQEDGKPWRFVFDTAMVNGIYIEHPIIQICSGSPNYHRFVLTFTPEGIQTKFDSNCVVTNPDLGAVRSKTNESLAARKKQDEEAGIQRIAILGAARVFIHGNQASHDHQELTKRVEAQCNRFLDVLEHARPNHPTAVGEPLSKFRTVNGGWAGIQEGSTGLPLISKIIGEITDPKVGKLPVTIMPSSGAYDRVENIQDWNYFEVSGTWGDDSKYLIGYSSAVLAFEPYGFWTEIELRNAMAQGKPVAVITKPGDPLNGVEQKEIELPGGQKGIYRRYSDARDAAIWIKRTWNARFLDIFQEQTQLFDDHFAQLKSAYLETKINFEDFARQVLKLVPSEHKRTLKLSLLRQHGEMLKLLSNEDKADFEMVVSALRQNPGSLQYVSEVMKKNKDMQAVAHIAEIPHRIYFANKLIINNTKHEENLIARLNKYMENRKTNKREYYYFGFFNCLGGYSKTQKFEAVKGLLQCLKHENNHLLSNQELGVLRQGKLGKLIARWEAESSLNIDAFVEKGHTFHSSSSR